MFYFRNGQDNKEQIRVIDAEEYRNNSVTITIKNGQGVVFQHLSMSLRTGICVGLIPEDSIMTPLQPGLQNEMREETPSYVFLLGLY